MCIVVKAQQITEVLDLGNICDISMKYFLSKTTVFLAPET